MAEKADKRHEAPAAAADPKPGKAASLLAKTPMLLGAVMLVEAVVLFAGVKFIGGGKPSGAGAAEFSPSEHSHGPDDDGHRGRFPQTPPRQGKNPPANVPV